MQGKKKVTPSIAAPADREDRDPPIEERDGSRYFLRENTYAGRCVGRFFSGGRRRFCASQAAWASAEGGRGGARATGGETAKGEARAPPRARQGPPYKSPPHDQLLPSSHKTHTHIHTRNQSNTRTKRPSLLRPTASPAPTAFIPLLARAPRSAKPKVRFFLARPAPPTRAPFPEPTARLVPRDSGAGKRGGAAEPAAARAAGARAAGQRARTRRGGNLRSCNSSFPFPFPARPRTRAGLFMAARVRYWTSNGGARAAVANAGGASACARRRGRAERE